VESGEKHDPMIRNPTPCPINKERRTKYARKTMSLRIWSWATRARTRMVGTANTSPSTTTIAV
jgi:hypothetical protein